MNNDQLRVALAQMSPVWLDKAGTTKKIIEYIHQAGREKADLIVFPEAILPGYPFWLSMTGGAQFNSSMQKEIHAHYMRNAVATDGAELELIARAGQENDVAIYLGMVERPMDRGGHSLYCSLVFIDQYGAIKSVHRKLQPTYEERLTWSPGDGHGLRVHDMGPFRLGGLNCWENWMPLSRTALYGQGENVHVAVWPGQDSNTKDITRFIAKESRSYVLSVSGLMQKSDFPIGTPHLQIILDGAPDMLANGGTCIAQPDGQWLVEPLANEEKLIFATLDIHRIFEERQNFDVAGHYSRPDVTRLEVNRNRQRIIGVVD